MAPGLNVISTQQELYQSGTSSIVDRNGCRIERRQQSAGMIAGWSVISGRQERPPWLAGMAIGWYTVTGRQERLQAGTSLRSAGTAAGRSIVSGW